MRLRCFVSTGIWLFLSSQFFCKSNHLRSSDQSLSSDVQGNAEQDFLQRCNRNKTNIAHTHKCPCRLISLQGQCSNVKWTLFSFFKENIRYPVWTCREPISLILGTRFSLILGARIGSLKHLKKSWHYYSQNQFVGVLKNWHKVFNDSVNCVK